MTLAARCGFLSDRAKVYVVLGEPDQLYEQNTNGTRTSYRSVEGPVLGVGQYRVRLIFYDDWHGQLAQPISETEFQHKRTSTLRQPSGVCLY